MARVCSVCGKELSFRASTPCKECKRVFKKVQRYILVTRKIDEGTLVLLKRYDRNMLIDLYCKLYAVCRISTSYKRQEETIM